MATIPWLLVLLCMPLLCRAASVLPLHKQLHHAPRRSALSSSSPTSMPADVADLTTGGLGWYSAPMSLGTPAQTQMAALDTGSGVIHIPCATATASSRASDPALPLFNPTASTSISAPASCESTACDTLCNSSSTCKCQYGICEYIFLYGDKRHGGGIVYTDQAVFNHDPATAAPLLFGCATFFTDGSFLDASPYSVGINWRPGSLLMQLEAAGVMDDTFGFCLGDGGRDEELQPSLSPDYGASAPSAHGLLVLGSATLATPLAQTLSTTLIDTAAYAGPSDGPLFPGLWLELHGVSIGGVTLVPDNPEGFPMLLDTGTSRAVFPLPLRAALLNATVAALSSSAADVVTAAYDPYAFSGGGLGVLFSSPKTPAQLDTAASGLPTLQLTLGPADSAVTLTLPPSHYMFPNSTRWPDDAWVLPLSCTSAYEQTGILGNSVLRGLWVQATRSTRAVTIGVLSDGMTCDSLTFDDVNSMDP